MDPTPDPLTTRLVGVAAYLALPGLGPRIEAVVALALDLVLADRGTPATVAVASLGPGATLRDAGDEIREMLEEQGVLAPLPQQGQDPVYATALWAVGFGGLSIGEFSVVFYNFLPPWEVQNTVERQLVVLLDEWERETDPTKREPVAATIRTVAATASGGTLP